MTPEEKSAWNRAYYLRNRQKYIDRSKKFHQENREKCMDYQHLYYQRVTKHVRMGFGALTPIRSATSTRHRDKETVGGNHRHYAWGEGMATKKDGVTINWND
jgi:hypothetical protein